MFVDIGDKQIKCIKENISRLGIIEQSTVLKKDAFLLLKTLKNTTFDILFIDPPYTIGAEKYIELFNLLEESKRLLAVDAHIFLEMPTPLSDQILNSKPNCFKILKQKRSSTTTLAIMQLV